MKGKLDGSPLRVLSRMNEYLKGENLKRTDEAWLVVEKDQWNNDQLTQLHKWSLKAGNYGFALSNPKFEYWLLLHFEDAKSLSSRECTEHLKRHLPDYDKNITPSKITPERITDAIRRDGSRDTPSCPVWPQTSGTTVYKLVKNILA